MTSVRAVRRDVLRGIALVAVAVVLLLVAVAGFAAAAIAGPPGVVRVLLAVAGAAVTVAGALVFARGWRALLHPGGPGRRRPGQRPPVGRAAQRQHGSTTAPVPFRTRFARAAWMSTDDRQVVRGYLIMAGPIVLAAALLGVSAVVAGIVDAAGHSGRLSWLPLWVVVVLQAVSLVGVVAMGRRAYADRQVRHASFFGPLAMIFPAAALTGTVVVPATLAAVTACVALIMRAAARRGARSPVGQP